LREHEDAEEDDLAAHIREGLQTAELLTLQNQPLGGDLTRGVVAGHQGDEHDLQHDQAGDEAAGIELLDLMLRLTLHLHLRSSSWCVESARSGLMPSSAKITTSSGKPSSMARWSQTCALSRRKIVQRRRSSSNNCVVTDGISMGGNS
jgi:hypothetical protein